MKYFLLVLVLQNVQNVLLFFARIKMRAKNKLDFLVHLYYTDDPIYLTYFFISLFLISASAQSIYTTFVLQKM